MSISVMNIFFPPRFSGNNILFVKHYEDHQERTVVGVNNNNNNNKPRKVLFPQFEWSSLANNATMIAKVKVFFFFFFFLTDLPICV